MKTYEKLWIILPCLTMASCAPFVETSTESTTVGVVINHQQAFDWVLNIFSKPESLSLVNEK